MAKKPPINSFNGFTYKMETEEQIKGQESIVTLENGKYMPPSEPKEEVTHGEGEDKKIKKEKQKKLSKNGKELGRPKEDRETKQRISLAVFPSVYDDIGKIAYVDRDTISNLIGKCLEEYIKQNQDKIEEYDRLKK